MCTWNRAENTRVPTAERKRMYITLPLRGDITSELIPSRLREADTETCYAAKLSMPYSSSVMMNLRPNDQLLRFSSSCCVYSFTCSCPTSYIGKNHLALNRQSQWAKFSRLRSGRIGWENSAIARHLVDTDTQSTEKNHFDLSIVCPVEVNA